MADTSKMGLYDKFIIIDKRTNKVVEENTFTLVPSRDTAAQEALLLYADIIEKDNPELASNLRDWMDSLI